MSVASSKKLRQEEKTLFPENQKYLTFFDLHDESISHRSQKSSTSFDDRAQTCYSGFGILFAFNHLDRRAV